MCDSPNVKPPACQDGAKDCPPRGVHMKVSKSRIWDTSQKSFYLQNNELVAGYLQGPNLALEEAIYWITNRAFDPEKFPVILSIQGGKQCLSCTSDDKPRLQLETTNIEDLFSNSKEDTIRFTFFRTYKDGMWRFESAAHPGWFLGTSSRTNKPICLAQDQGKDHVLDFFFQLC